MTLFLIGLGLGDERDITLKGLEIVKSADRIFLEHYTSLLSVGKEQLEKFYKKKITLADRELIEQHAEQILQPAKNKNIALLVVGDPFGATTHADLLLRAKKEKIDVRIIHNASIINAIGEIGLELYKYGRTASIPFEEGALSETPYNVIAQNQEQGLHTLCLLDIKVAEPSKEDLLQGRATPQPPRFMTVNQGLELLERVEAERKEQIITPELLLIGIARLGQEDQLIKCGTFEELKNVDFGRELHSLIIPGKLHDIEKEMLTLWK